MSINAQESGKLKYHGIKKNTNHNLMDAQTHAELKAHVKALAEILRRETNPETIKTFKSIEYAV